MSKEIEEKAKELIEKLLLFQPLIPDYDREGQAKQCALICVDEMLKTINGYQEFYGVGCLSIDELQQVKQEINKQ